MFKFNFKQVYTAAEKSVVAKISLRFGKQMFHPDISGWNISKAANYIYASSKKYFKLTYGQSRIAPKFSHLHIFKFSNQKIAFITIFSSFLIWYIFALPKPLFNSPVSLVVRSSNGKLLGARIANDGQWRFPNTEKVPGKFAASILAFEDKRFYDHFGVDILAIARAVKQNFSSGKRKSGASTLSMQVIRMSRGNPGRTYKEKLLEMVLTTRLELGYSKKEILALYASNAPFGGNVVGLEAAAWRYFGKPAQNLTWAESATLAVLPNSPALVHPGRNRKLLLAKRNFLLCKLKQQGKIDSVTCALSQMEPLPQKPFPLPEMAPQLSDKFYIRHKSNPTQAQPKTSIDFELQQKVNKILENKLAQLNGNGVYNAAVLVADVKTGNVLAYAGNLPSAEKEAHNNSVDNIVAARSTGSILKPFLYASMLDDGSLLPETLVPDIPTFIKSFTPKNYDFNYEGTIAADKALSRSLNIPAVHMLNAYKPSRFANQLRKMGLTTIRKQGDHYGLTLILGGAEANLWELCGSYASMARTINHYNETGHYFTADFHPLKHFPDDAYMEKSHQQKTPAVLSAAAIWLTFEAMVKVARPDENLYWNSFAGSRKIAWKTGTSFGNRDAWSIGVTPDYVVGVWVGNSNGEGRPGLTGIGSAAPILFDVFDALPQKNAWFKMPVKDMQQLEVCAKSGCIASDICPEKKIIWAPKKGNRTKVCSYHIEIHTDKSGQWRVHSACEDVGNIYKKAWFVLPASEEKYYKLKHPEYLPLPAYRADCKNTLVLSENSSIITMLYPKNGTKIYLPVNGKGEMEKTVFEAAHRRKNAVIYWSVDDEYLGSTADGAHRFALSPAPGLHQLTLIDDEGDKLQRNFEIVGK